MKNFFQSILNSILGLFGFGGKEPVKKNVLFAAKTAGYFVAANNKDKVSAILPIADALLEAAKSGTLTGEQIDTGFDMIEKKIDDPKWRLLLSEVTFPSIYAGEVNQETIDIISAFIEGCKLGA
jgi:hypothetical protein